MSDEYWMPADAFMKRLEANPEYAQRKAERTKRRADRALRARETVQPVIDDLRRQGVLVQSVQELIERHAPLSPDVVSILSDWLPKITDDQVREGLVRALGAASEPFDGSILVDCFNSTSSESLRWAIANTIAEVRPLGISVWLVTAVTKVELGDSRQMLVLALGRMMKPRESRPILRSLLSQMPGHVALALADVGDDQDAKVLGSMLESIRGEVSPSAAWIRASLAKAIHQIESRLQGNAQSK